MQTTLTRIHERIKKTDEAFSAITKEISGAKSVFVIFLCFMTAGVTFTGTGAPFVIALFSVVLQYKTIPFVAVCITILGLALVKAQSALPIYILFVILYSVLHMLIKGKKTGIKALVVSLVYFTASVSVAAFEGLTFYDFLYGAMFSVLSGLLYIIYSRAFSGLDDIGKKIKLSKEQYAALFIIVFLALSSMTSFTIAGVNIGVMIYLFVTMLCAFYGNIGLSGLFVLSTLFIGHLSGFNDMFIYILLSITVLICGLTKDSSKVLYCIAVAIGWLVTAVLFSETGTGEFYIVETLLGIILFASFPAQGGRYLFELIGPDQRDKTAMVYHAKGKLLTAKITGLTSMLQKMSTLIPDEEFKNTEIKNDAYRLIDIAAGKICENCSKCPDCWEENFYSTYQAIFAAVATINTGGTFNENDLPGKFKRTCLKVEDFVTSINNSCEIFKMDKIYRRHIDNIKDIASEQLNHLASYIHGYYETIDLMKSKYKEVENKLYSMLSSIGILPVDICIQGLGSDLYMVELLYDKTSLWRENLDLILSVVSRIMGGKIEYETGYFGDSYDVKVTCRPMKQYFVNTWIAKKAASDCSTSGDSCTFFENTKGLYISAVGDGMGTGKKAHSRSELVMNLLECLYEDHPEHESVLHIINSFLAMKTEQESFSTIDMCTINLFSGEMELIKAGGCNTFIFDGKEVKMLGSNTAPVGILNKPNLSSVKEQAEDMTVVVLLTDGIFDLIGENDLRYIIGMSNSNNVSRLADVILNSALEKCQHKPHDDMLVLVNKVWKK